jgi:hypothetical protein
MPSDPHSFDEIRLPFIFVPHGEPEPAEVVGSYADWIKLPATFVPHGHDDGQSNASSGGQRPGQRRSAGGPTTASGTAAPGSSGADATSDPACDETSGTSGGASIPDDPIAAFGRASDGLATAASGHASGSGSGQVAPAAAGISKVDDSIRQ